MANKEHLAILEKGVEAWNEWRWRGERIIGRTADLEGADLSDRDFCGINFGSANLRNANFMRSNLSRAEFSNSDLRGANLSDADLRGAKMARVNLTRADLTRTKLDGLHLTHCGMGGTLLASVDLSGCHGLEEVSHYAPSTIGIDTIHLSKGRISPMFLRRAGVPEPFVIQMKALVGAMEPIQFYSCFISYSSKDHNFAERLYADLQGKGVRCWFAPEDIKIGDRFRERIDEAVRLYDKLLLVLSESSIESPWVEDEVEAALEKERLRNRTVLFPIRLDDAVMASSKAWAARVRRILHMGDFRIWKEHDKYRKAFERLIKDLRAEETIKSSE